MSAKYEITAIEVQKKDPNRSSIFINGVFSFGLTNKAIERYGLVQGLTLNEEEYENLMSKLQLDKAKVRALNSIARGDKTEQQIRNLLQKDEYNEWIIEEVICFLKKYNYINDDAFIKRYIDSKVRYGHKSLKKIQAELYTKGVYLNDLNTFKVNYEKEEEENIIYFLKKFKYDKELEYEAKKKLINKILTRGFSYGQIERCIRMYEEDNID